MTAITPTTATKDFFISYTKADRAWAEWIAWTLEQAEYTCIIQAWDFVPGMDFIQQMRSALDVSRQVIAVLSDNYLSSEAAGSELNAALVNDPLGIRGGLVPVRVAPCKLGGLVKGRIYIDLVGSSLDQAKRDLLQGIAAARLGRRPDRGEAEFARPPKFPGGDAAAERKQESARSDQEERDVVTILYFGCETGSGLNLKGQADGIAKTLRESPLKEQLKLTTIFDVTTESIFETLNEHQPAIVHFAGKQNGGNVLIPTPSGRVTTISDLAFAGLLQNLDNDVSLAIIDTCKSLRCARAVTSVVDFAIGVEDDIFDNDAIRYYDVFYAALAAGKSLAAACGQATAALRFNDVAESSIPQLCVRAGVDAAKLRFVQIGTH
jgi:hypothetical protein